MELDHSWDVGPAEARAIQEPLPLERGARAPLVDGGEVVGAVVRTRRGVRPVYVSVGHRVSLDTAVAWVLHCAPHFRLPETTRAAHRLASGGCGARSVASSARPDGTG